MSMIIKLRVNTINTVMDDIQEAHEDVKTGAMSKRNCIELIAECRDVKMSLVSELWNTLYKGYDYEWGNE